MTNRGDERVGTDTRGTRGIHYTLRAGRRERMAAQLHSDGRRATNATGHLAILPITVTRKEACANHGRTL